MKHAILSTEADAKALQAADDEAAGLPWPSVYLDGRPCPTAWTTHRYDVRKHPTEELYAYPVDDAAIEKAPIEAEPIGKGGATKGGIVTEVRAPIAYVDELDPSWEIGVV